MEKNMIISERDFLAEAEPWNAVKIGYGRWEIRVVCRGKMLRVDTTNEDHYDDRATWAQLAWDKFADGPTLNLEAWGEKTEHTF